jgi:hypothetical protein
MNIGKIDGEMALKRCLYRVGKKKCPHMDFKEARVFKFFV